MKKKAFSLSELMVALSIMAVLSAILIPSLTKSLPNQDKYLFKTAYGLLSNTVNELINDDSLYPNGNFQNANTQYFCLNFANKLNTISVDCGSSPPDNFATNLTTSNGMSWGGLKVGGQFNNAAHSNQIKLWIRKGLNDEGEDAYFVTIFDNGRLQVDTPKGVEYLKED